MQVDIFDFNLPKECIAAQPATPRDTSRLLDLSVEDQISDRRFYDLPSLLKEGDVLVFNDTKVIPARLYGARGEALVEVTLYHPVDGIQWWSFIKNAKRLHAGDTIRFYTAEISAENSDFTATVIEKKDEDGVLISFDCPPNELGNKLEKYGFMPLPPYIKREKPRAGLWDKFDDKENYQTVYAKHDGAVAAPTAGLHFTDSLLQRLADAGIERADVTLHVGAGTFQPVKSDTMGGHPMHSEFIEVERKFILRLVEQLKNRRPVVAVGTTSVRTIESLYYIGRDILEGKWSGEVWQWAPYDSCDSEPDTMDALVAIIDYLEEQGEDSLRARTRIIIAPGFRYRIVDTVITNFHQPKSTLLLLVSALIGDSWRCLYAHALDSGYRFLSYGDACLFSR